MKTILIILLVTLPAALLSAGAQAEAWDYWDSSNEGSSLIIDHSKWQNFLDNYLEADTADGINLLDYEAAASGRSLLDEYISAQELVRIRSYSRDEQFAYWVNLYNAVTVRLILDNYPVESIRKISNPWDRKLVRIDGQEVSLNDIEHRILRPLWADPRIHFVVNCASLGCPNLPSEALTASNKNALLDTAARDYLNHSRGIRFERGRLILSSIFDWYQEDFGEDEDLVLDFISEYRNLSAIEKEAGKPVKSLPVKYDYDWNLNGGK